MSSPDNGASEPQARAALGADFIVPALACALTLYYLASTTDLVWEARATGTVIGVTLLALCAVHLARLGMRIASGAGTFATGDLFENNLFNRQRLGLGVMIALYIITIHWVGATIGLFLVLVGCMWVLGVRRVRTLVGVALIAAAIVHLALITLLDSKLPRGWIIDQFAPTPASEATSKKK